MRTNWRLFVFVFVSIDDWWGGSSLETDETENAVADLGDAVGKDESDLPLIRVDFAVLLCDTGDPLITTSWLQTLVSRCYLTGIILQKREWKQGVPA